MDLEQLDKTADKLLTELYESVLSFLKNQLDASSYSDNILLAKHEQLTEILKLKRKFE